mmetsp:Transcript_138009/g.311157  ORF Transcript_138009/g.311157 Transcript_138009/m.311157 type:complete len:338 (-) Transcript_138009:88-1101(-)
MVQRLKTLGQHLVVLLWVIGLNREVGQQLVRHQVKPQASLHTLEIQVVCEHPLQTEVLAYRSESIPKITVDLRKRELLVEKRGLRPTPRWGRDQVQFHNILDQERYRCMAGLSRAHVLLLKNPVSSRTNVLLGAKSSIRLRHAIGGLPRLLENIQITSSGSFVHFFRRAHGIETTHQVLPLVLDLVPGVLLDVEFEALGHVTPVLLGRPESPHPRAALLLLLIGDSVLFGLSEGDEVQRSLWLHDHFYRFWWLPRIPHLDEVRKRNPIEILKRGHLQSQLLHAQTPDFLEPLGIVTAAQQNIEPLAKERADFPYPGDVQALATLRERRPHTVIRRLR